MSHSLGGGGGGDTEGILPQDISDIGSNSFASNDSVISVPHPVSIITSGTPLLTDSRQCHHGRSLPRCQHNSADGCVQVLCLQ